MRLDSHLLVDSSINGTINVSELNSVQHKCPHIVAIAVGDQLIGFELNL